MSASLHRTLLIAAPLALILSACKNQALYQQPGLGDTNPAIGDMPSAAQPAIPSDRCTGWDFEMADPCDPGECTPDKYAIVPWSEESPGSPELSWTYPCNPDGYRVKLYQMGATQEDPFVELAADDITAFDPAVGGPRRSWQPGIDLQPATAYSYSLEPYRSGESPSSTSGSTHFWTGPFCPGVATEAPTLVEPEDGHIITAYQAETNNLGGFTWTYPDAPCLVRFEGQLASNEAFTDYVIPLRTLSSVEHWGGVLDPLTWCHTYYWHVRAWGVDGPGPWSETWSIVLQPSEGVASCLQQSPIEASALENAVCRFGPGTSYAATGYLSAGETHKITGRNADASWLKLETCWVARSLLHTEADLEAIPVLPAPPLPTPTRSCWPTMGAGQCSAAGGTWVPAPPGLGPPGTGKCDCP